MDLGRLDRRIELVRPIVATNGRNERVPSGMTESLATVLARRDPVSDGERNAGSQVQRVVTDRFTTHWSAVLADLLGTDQLVCAGVTYDIVGIKELGRREGLEISARALRGIGP